MLLFIWIVLLVINELLLEVKNVISFLILFGVFSWFNGVIYFWFFWNVCLVFLFDVFVKLLISGVLIVLGVMVLVWIFLCLYFIVIDFVKLMILFFVVLYFEWYKLVVCLENEVVLIIELFCFIIKGNKNLVIKNVFFILIVIILLNILIGYLWICLVLLFIFVLLKIIFICLNFCVIFFENCLICLLFEMFMWYVVVFLLLLLIDCIVFFNWFDILSVNICVFFIVNVMVDVCLILVFVLVIIVILFFKCFI